jgi:hypothetical protein
MNLINTLTTTIAGKLFQDCLLDYYFKPLLKSSSLRPDLLITWLLILFDFGTLSLCRMQVVECGFCLSPK